MFLFYRGESDNCEGGLVTSLELFTNRKKGENIVFIEKKKLLKIEENILLHKHRHTALKLIQKRSS